MNGTTKQAKAFSEGNADPERDRFSRTPRSVENLIKMEPTKFSRKLDGSGRIMIPIRLREQMGLVSGNEYNFFTYECEGRRFICIECPATSDTELAKAMQLVQANGMKIVQDDA